MGAQKTIWSRVVTAARPSQLHPRYPVDRTGEDIVTV
jgi:hypothetical protein